MARTKSFKFRISQAERKMITMLAAYFRRTESDMVRQLIAEAAAANSITNPRDDEKEKDFSSSFGEAHKVDEK